MPELPEVEYWRQRLHGWLTHRRLDEILLSDPAVARPQLSTRPTSATPTAARQLRELAGQTVCEVLREGKRLGLRLDEGGVVLHLGMTGRFQEGEAPQHARIGLRAGDRTVWLADARRLGCAVPTTSAMVREVLRAGLGPDALNALCDAAQLKERLRGRRALKEVLMDQSVLAGLGNIHATEVLWRAGLHPQRPAGTIAAFEAETLVTAIREQIAETLAALPVEEDLVYLTQGGRNPFAVYGREGAPCPRCREAILKTVLAARGTWWCPRCQAPNQSSLT